MHSDDGRSSDCIPVFTVPVCESARLLRRVPRIIAPQR